MIFLKKNIFLESFKIVEEIDQNNRMSDYLDTTDDIMIFTQITVPPPPHMEFIVLTS